jgi:hypothetical protein
MSSMMNSIYIPTVQLQEKPGSFNELQKTYHELEKVNDPDAGEDLSQMGIPHILFFLCKSL